MFWESAAWAMGSSQPGEEGGPDQLSPWLLIFAIVAIFWLVVIGPQKRQQQRHQDRLKNLKKGERVMTSGGIFGTVIKNEENAVTLAIGEVPGGGGKKKGDNVVHVQVSPSAITAVLADEKKEGKSEETEN